jgi:hypothetical protein
MSGFWCSGPVTRNAIKAPFARALAVLCGALAGPLAWSAPEVLEGTVVSGVVANTATDVYQFGGMLHEIMTCGDAPFWWLQENSSLLAQRRCSAGPMRIPATSFWVEGLLGKSTLQAATIDKERVTWRVRVVEGSDGSAGRLRDLVAILERCLEENPSRRPNGGGLYVCVVCHRVCVCGGGGAGAVGLNTNLKSESWVCLHVCVMWQKNKTHVQLVGAAIHADSGDG